jgi:raffinose/stachyose/melibiose transport system permease protein
LTEPASVPRIFFTVVLPIMKPAIVSVAILETMWIWNDFLLPYLTLGYATSTRRSPSPSSTSRAATAAVDMGAMMGCLVLAIVPIIIFYLICQKYIISGVMAGAVKG